MLRTDVFCMEKKVANMAVGYVNIVIINFNNIAFIKLKNIKRYASI